MLNREINILKMFVSFSVCKLLVSTCEVLFVFGGTGFVPNGSTQRITFSCCSIRGQYHQIVPQTSACRWRNTEGGDGGSFHPNLILIYHQSSSECPLLILSESQPLFPSSHITSDSSHVVEALKKNIFSFVYTTDMWDFEVNTCEGHNQGYLPLTEDQLVTSWHDSTAAVGSTQPLSHVCKHNNLLCGAGMDFI